MEDIRAQTQDSSMIAKCRISFSACANELVEADVSV